MAIGSRRAGAQNYEALRRATAELLEAKRRMKTVATEAQRLHAKACGRSRIGGGADRRVECLLTEGM